MHCTWLPYGWMLSAFGAFTNYGQAGDCLKYMMVTLAPNTRPSIPHESISAINTDRTIQGSPEISDLGSHCGCALKSPGAAGHRLGLNGRAQSYVGRESARKLCQSILERKVSGMCDSSSVWGAVLAVVLSHISHRCLGTPGCSCRVLNAASYAMKQQ